jgi:hypothetical protein
LFLEFSGGFICDGFLGGADLAAGAVGKMHLLAIYADNLHDRSIYMIVDARRSVIGRVKKAASKKRAPRTAPVLSVAPSAHVEQDAPPLAARLSLIWIAASLCQ